ncbi:MAG TPA: hypothetical protein VE822_06975, partial [Candidatus Elarobacter sp.]|nr:hypothetical protein [Candidatus Elarobacter sp.]
GYAPSSRLAQAENQLQRGPSQYFNSLLSVLASGLRRFLAFPALLVDYPATAGRVCAFLAPWKDEKSEATRHGWVFQQAPKAVK